MSQWNESQGGFNASQSPMAGKTPMTGGRNPGDICMIPVTVKLLKDAETSPDNSTKVINGKSLSTIKVCGRVTAVESKATYTSYTIDDSTGMMEVRHWNNDGEGDEPAKTDINENDYVNVVGKVSLYQGKAQINCYNVIKCQTYNQVVHHFISVMYCNETNKRTSSSSGGATSNNNNNTMATTNMGGTSAGDAGGDDMAEEMADWTDIQRKVYMAVKERQESHQNGVHVPDLVGQLGVSPGDLRDTLAFLTNEGMVYDTTSEEWVRTTS